MRQSLALSLRLIAKIANVMADDINYNSFLLRIWHIARTNHPMKQSKWVCEVESVQSGETWKVRSLEALLALLQEQIGNSQD